jgi:hypothetical protein
MPDAATTTCGNGGGQVRELVGHDQGLGLDGKGVMMCPGVWMSRVASIKGISGYLDGGYVWLCGEVVDMPGYVVEMSGYVLGWGCLNMCWIRLVMCWMCLDELDVSGFVLNMCRMCQDMC